MVACGPKRKQFPAVIRATGTSYIKLRNSLGVVSNIMDGWIHRAFLEHAWCHQRALLNCCAL